MQHGQTNGQASEHVYNGKIFCICVKLYEHNDVTSALLFLYINNMIRFSSLLRTNETLELFLSFPNSMKFIIAAAVIIINCFCIALHPWKLKIIPLKIL